MGSDRHPMSMIVRRQMSQFPNCLAVCISMVGPLAVAGCNVHVHEVPKEAAVASACSHAPPPFAITIQEALARNDYRCANEALIQAMSNPGDKKVVEVAAAVVKGRASGVPDTTKVVALNNLFLADNPDATFGLQNNLAAVRRVALEGDQRMRSLAIRVLAQRRSDDDVEVFAAAVSSGEDSFLVDGIIALADNCSAKARGVLGERLASSEVRSYVKRYSEKESITGYVRSRCPVP